MNQLQEKANYFRVCQLLIEKGGDAFRRVLQTKISSSPSPSTLKSLLCAYKKSLQKLRYSVINATQWKLLFPSSGSPDSDNFDITLLTILLRNICGLPSPVTGCSAMPPACDTSASAEILRIKMFRNEVYGHISIAQLDNIKFETLWQQISQTLINLGIRQQDIDKLKQTALSPEEENYIKKLKEWKELEDNLSSKLDDIEQEVVKLREEIVRSRKIEENVKTAEMNKLAKFVFEGKIKELSKKFQIVTRKWFFDEFKEWLDDKKSAVMILTAGPGVGKSVLSARICELYKESGQLAACHFCDFRTSDSRDPYRILESLASQMCDNVDGFRDKLTEVLSRKHSRDSLSDTFRVLLNDPLHALHRTEQMLIVVDALDESKAAVKSELSDLISDEFFQLPKWIKIFISSRPELQVREKLGHLNPVEIRPDDDKHNLDLKQFIHYHIPNISNSTLQSLVSKCEGSFLYAYHLVKEIPVKQVESEVIPNVNVDIPKGISGFYKKQFKCLKKDFTVSKCKVRTEEKRMETDPLVADVETKFYGLEDKGFGSGSPEIFSLHSNEMDFPMDEPRKHMSMFQAFYNFTNTAVQRCIHNMTSIITKSQDVDERKIISELLDSTSKIQAALGETIHSLDLFESYLKNPNERTAVSLKHSFDYGKCSDTPLKAEEINGFLEALRSLLISNSVNDKECKETAEDCCQDRYNSETKTLDLDFNSQSHHESTKKNFENRGWIGNGKLKNAAAAYDHNNPGNVIEKGKDYLAWKVQELEDENLSLKKQLESRKLQNRELLIELGQVTVEKTAKENEEKRYEHFRLIYHAREGERPGTSNIRNKRSNINMSATQNAYKNGYQQSSDASDSTKPQIAHGIYNPLIPITSNANPASSRSRESLVNGAEALVQQNNHEQNKDENDENESGLEGSENERNRVSAVKTSRDEQTATTQNTASVQPEETGAHDQASTSRNDNSDLSFSVQQDDSGRESVSLSNIPPASVATTLYNNYKFLLLLLAQKLLSSDVTKLKDWAAQNFSISNPQNATDILLQLDQKGVINASDLRQLSDFLESILRFDLVYIIDAFLLGDYSLLRQSQASKNHAVNLVQNHGNRALFRNSGFSNAISTRQFSTSLSKSLTISRKPVNNSEVQNSLPQSQPQASRNFSTQQYPNKPAAGYNSIRMVEVAAGEGPVTNERRTTSGTAGTRTTSLPASETGKSSTVSSNGSKLSKFQRPDNERSNSPHWDPGLDSNWLCSHYKRHCYVKFDCCDKFWPCHRCHNNQSTCGRKKLKSRDTRMLKCAYCNKVQQFGEYCCDCGAKFASYYCGLCKHLTGTDDHPYHCEKCGICRIHGDRSFHCDVCGVCLDVQLRGNHKCRAGSAHDECCICLEDAFTGCQILPCSHKVHKECATQMIRSGITRCPICRESFAHKLERQPQNSRKRPGKF